MSTSSPILAQQNFEAYHQVVQTSLATATEGDLDPRPTGAQCVTRIRNVTLHLQDLAADDPAALARLFNLCDPTLVSLY